VFTMLSWNVANFFSLAADADTELRQAFKQKVEELKNIITAQAPDIVGLQEVGDPEAFETLRAELGLSWQAVLSTHFEAHHAIRVGWLSPRVLSDVEEVIDLPAALTPVKGGRQRRPHDEDGPRRGRGHRHHRRRNGCTSAHHPPEVQAADIPR
jgi:endonuclease/exonuclease/phosphatase family metal-dependent hydrolase